MSESSKEETSYQIIFWTSWCFQGCLVWSIFGTACFFNFPLLLSQRLAEMTLLWWLKCTDGCMIVCLRSKFEWVVRLRQEIALFYGNQWFFFCIFLLYLKSYQLQHQVCNSKARCYFCMSVPRLFLWNITVNSHSAPVTWDPGANWKL